MGEKAEKAAGNIPKGFEVGYKVFTINGRQLGHGAPIKVKRENGYYFIFLTGAQLRYAALPCPAILLK